MADTEPSSEVVDFEMYRYEPSMTLAVVFIVLFLAVTTLHTYQLIRTRSWSLIPLVIGGHMQWIGYIGRAISANEAPDYSLGPYIMQTLLLLIAPALYAASIYMILGRIIRLVDGAVYSIIPLRWLTKLFVFGDVVSFLTQGAGGGIMASGNVSSIEMGENIIIGGLVVQVLFFSLFLLTSSIFHVRMSKAPTRKATTPKIPWKIHMYSLYAVSALILVRSVFRLIEYAQGNDGYLISHEVFLYVFDSVLMFFVMAIMAWVHPSEITAQLKGRGAIAVRMAVRFYQIW